MPNTFIAVQCYQCSTMQVKQQKKSSNKWSCVVCNEKQSVRKVSARAFMAKEVRKFVQSFNMARQFDEEKAMAPPEIDDDDHNHHHQLMNDHKKKRTDWSDYISPEDEITNETDDDEGDEFEPKVVTELPKSLFKKPKLNNYCSSSDGGDGEKAFWPVFGKRNNKRQKTSQARELNEYNSTEAKKVCDDQKVQKGPTVGASKWKPYETRNGDDGSGDYEPVKHKLSHTKGASKWSEYLAEDNDGGDCLGLNSSGRDFTAHSRKWNSDALELVYEDQMVEEDIHPDFM